MNQLKMMLRGEMVNKDNMEIKTSMERILGQNPNLLMRQMKTLRKDTLRLIQLPLTQAGLLMKATVPQLLDLPAILIPATQLLMLAELLMMAMVHQKMDLEMLTLDTQSLMWKQLPEMLKANIPLHLNMKIQAEMLNTPLLLTVTMPHQQ